MRDPYQIFETVRVTEKGTAQSEKENKNTFCVAKNATKQEIKYAFEKIFKKKPVSVNTMQVGGKEKRTRFGFGKKPDWKKAIVTLKQGDKIDLV